jgi:hypothetical protein
MTCYVRAPSCFALDAGTGSFQVEGFADDNFTTTGSGLAKLWNETPAIVTATLSGSTVQVTRQGAGSGQLRVTIGGTHVMVDIHDGAVCP